MEAPFISAEQQEWEHLCPAAITSDFLWKMDAYRAALFLLHVALADEGALAAARVDPGIRSQIVRAAGSVSANIAEGYSRSTRADRLRFMGYALGSCRECVSWYQAAAGGLPDEIVGARHHLLARIRSLLLGLIRSIRANPGPRPHFEK